MFNKHGGKKLALHIKLVIVKMSLFYQSSEQGINEDLFFRFSNLSDILHYVLNMIFFK